MSFAAPWMLLGGLAAAVPVVIHLIGRRRAVRRRFAALEFLLASDRRVARRLRLRQLLLLAARVALIVALVLMVAKPFAEEKTSLPAVSSGPLSAVLIVDDTLSMQRSAGSGSLFDRGVERAEALVSSLGGLADVAVLSLTSPEGPLARLTRDRRTVQRALEQLKVTQRHAALGPALAAADRLLQRSRLAQRHIFVLSDMARHGLVERPSVASGVQLHPVELARDLPRANRAVAGLSLAASSDPAHRSVKLVARVCQYGGEAGRFEVRLAIDGHPAGRGFAQLPAEGCVRKTFNHTFARGGHHRARVELSGEDVLAADDRRFAQVDLQSDMRVLLVNGSPSAVRHRDELFYLRAALQTADRDVSRKRRITTEEIAPRQLRSGQLAAFDAVVLANVKQIKSAQAEALVHYVRGGGGLFISLGDNVDAGRTNARLGQLLPQPLRGPISAAPPGSGGGALRIGRIASDHPLISAIWSAHEGAGLRQARFFRAYRLRPSRKGDRRVVLAFDDGSPALVAASRGRGRVLLLTSTVDRAWNDLPIRPGYLPLMQQAIRYLAKERSDDRSRPSVMVGKSHRVALPAGLTDLELLGPGGIERSFDDSDLSKEHVEVEVERAGFYHFRGTRDGGKRLPLERLSFAANVDPRESQLAAGKLKRRSGAAGQGGQAVRRVELWHALGGFLLLLLLGESWLGRRG